MAINPSFGVRRSHTQAIYALLEERFGFWVSAEDLATVGGFCAWRTRVSDARALAEHDEREIIWNGKAKDSAYMLRPKRLGRDASLPLSQKALF